MATPPAAQGSPTWWSSSSDDDATSSASASSSSPSPPHAAPSSNSRGTSSPRPPPPPPSCAACKHQRRSCGPDCPLKPYFVADDDPNKFRNAVRMFGIKSLKRMLLEAVPSPRRDACVRTIVYESDVRAADPVRGCSGVIEDLENQLMDTAVELEVLRRRLDSYRRQMAARGGQSQPPNNPLVERQQQLMMARTGDDDVQKQGPDGVSPAANEIAATPPQLPSATEMVLQSSQVQPQLSTTPPPP